MHISNSASNHDAKHKTRKAVYAAIDSRIQSMQDIPQVKAFAADVEKLKQLDSDASLPGITAQVWLDKIAEIPLSKLRDYVRQYRPGLLDAIHEHDDFVGRS